MIGNIKRYNGMSSGGSFNPDDMFDENNTATEENFIKLLEHNVYDSKYIGYKVQLSNSVDYNNGIWVIADVNHDSANTGQTNCYDLISQDCFYSAYNNGTQWRNSAYRTWLNNTFYPGFSTKFKSRVLNPKYKSQSTWYTDDKIILPSLNELNNSSSSSTTEGIAYPIFTNSASRIKYQSGTTRTWWTRTLINNKSYSWYVSSDGNMSYGSYSYGYLAPILRVQ